MILTWGQEVQEASQERGRGSGRDSSMQATGATEPPGAPWPSPLAGRTVKGLLQETPVKPVMGRTQQKPHGSRAASAGGHLRARPLQQTAQCIQMQLAPQAGPALGAQSRDPTWHCSCSSGWHLANSTNSHTLCLPCSCLTRGIMNVPLICDYGSGFSKVGFAGTEAPLAVFPTTLGKLRHEVSARRPPWGPQPLPS